MKKIALTLIFLLSRELWAGACCIGGGPRSFVQLKQLQTYDLGIATSFRDLYGRYDPYGQILKAEGQETYTVALGASVRVFSKLETYAIAPLVARTRTLAAEERSQIHVGDVLVGGRFTLYDPLFLEDWFAETKILFSLKAPTGTSDELGTGNGLWEPSLGVQFQKDFSLFLASLSASYTARLTRTVQHPVNAASLSVKEGDRIEIAETLTVPVTTNFSLTGGSSQVWDRGSAIEGQGVEDSHGRYVTALVAATYFLDRFWKVTAAFESVLPIPKTATNEDAYRTLTITSTYAIY